MRGLITITLLLMAGQASAAEQVISVQHDSHRGVTCWILNDTGISCLPDSSLPQAHTSTKNPESEAVRASMRIPANQNEQLHTTPLPLNERLQL